VGEWLSSKMNHRPYGNIIFCRKFIIQFYCAKGESVRCMSCFLYCFLLTEFLYCSSREENLRSVQNSTQTSAELMESWNTLRHQPLLPGWTTAVSSPADFSPYLQ